MESYWKAIDRFLHKLIDTTYGIKNNIRLKGVENCLKSFPNRNYVIKLVLLHNMRPVRSETKFDNWFIDLGVERLPPGKEVLSLPQ